MRSRTAGIFAIAALSLLQACTEDRCAALYDEAEIQCIGAAGEPDKAAGAQACLKAYDKAHTELKAKRSDVLSPSARLGVSRQLSSLASAWERAPEGTAALLISNVLRVEKLECSRVVKEEEDAAWERSAFGKLAPIRLHGWPGSGFVLLLAGLAIAAAMAAAARKVLNGAKNGRRLSGTRRGDRRKPTHLREGKLVFTAHEHGVPCYVLDRSCGGAQVRVQGSLPEASLMTFTDEADAREYPATIAWRRGDRLGLQLWEPLPPGSDQSRIAAAKRRA